MIRRIAFSLVIFPAIVYGFFRWLVTGQELFGILTKLEAWRDK